MKKKNLFKTLKGFPVRFMLGLIAFYRRVISPALHAVFGSEGFCRFTPSCSEYARQAFMRHGFMKGFALSCYRLLRCNPLYPGGADPVPPKGRWRNCHEKVGIFGGCFDPVHNAHLTLAEAARDALGLDRVIFVPAAHSPLKEGAPNASAEARLEMLNAAIEKKAGFEVSDWELAHGGVSYSIETAKHFAEMFPFAEFYWLLGADQLAALGKWRDVESLARIVRFAAMCRDGDSLPALPADLAKFVSVEPLSVPPVDISSTFIREKISTLSDEELEHYMPRSVIRIIRKNKLYIHAD